VTFGLKKKKKRTIMSSDEEKTSRISSLSRGQRIHAMITA
jgi:hypothetical protein